MRGGRDHKRKANIWASFQSRGWANSKSPPVIKDVLHSDLSEEQSCSKPCFDSLFCAEEMRTQGVPGEEITCLVALKNCCGLCPQELQQLHSMDRLSAKRAFSFQFIKIYKEGFTLPVYCATLKKKHRNICTVSSNLLWFSGRCSWGCQKINFYIWNQRMKLKLLVRSDTSLHIPSRPDWTIDF